MGIFDRIKKAFGFKSNKIGEKTQTRNEIPNGQTRKGEININEAKEILSSRGINFFDVYGNGLVETRRDGNNMFFDKETVLGVIKYDNSEDHEKLDIESIRREIGIPHSRKNFIYEGEKEALKIEKTLKRSEPEPLYTLKQASRRIGLKEDIIKKLIEANLVSSSKLENSLYVSRKDIDHLTARYSHNKLFEKIEEYEQRTRSPQNISPPDSYIKVFDKEANHITV